MIFRNKVTKHKKQIAKFFDSRVLNFLKNKKPKSESYPFIQHDPFELYGEEKTGFESFYLVGSNWKNAQYKPIAVMWGFNDWKLGFTSDYLTEYRTLFVPRRMRGFRAIRNLKGHLDSNSVFIAWGFNERRSAKRYAKYKNIPLWRMEDAFIRSSALGASHATPYSLILDKTGFYYDCSQPSDVENILNLTNFKVNTQLLTKAKKALDTIIDFKLSKYNPPSNSTFRITDKIKTKKRIVVLGQVDSDASIRLGNPDKWTAEELVKLAKFENPDAEVLYRPHPEIYKGYQKSRFKKKRIERIATVVSPDEQFIDSLVSIDHVYTITSLSGFEALLHGKKVTVVGAPFYAGWGLTDDRVKIKRRTANLTLLELFAGSYLLYPNYLADLNDSYIGLMSSGYKIKSDKRISTAEIMKKRAINSVSADSTDEFICKIINNKIESFNGKLNFHSLISYGSDTYNFLMACLVIGRGASTHIDSILNSLQGSMNNDLFNKLLLLIHEYCDFDTTMYEARLLADVGEYELSKKICSDRLDQIKQVTKIHEDNTSEDDDPQAQIVREDLRLQKLKLVKTEFSLAVDTLNFTLLIDATSKLFMSGEGSHAELIAVAKVSEKTFNYKTAESILNLLTKHNIKGSNKNAIASLFKVHFESGGFVNNNMEQLAVDVLSLKPELHELTLRLLNDLALKGAIDKELLTIVNSSVSLGYKHNINFVNYLLEIGEVEKAESILIYMIDHGDNSDIVIITLSKLFSVNGNLARSEEMLKERITNSLSLSVARELIRIFNIRGKYVEAIELYDILLVNNLPVCKSILLPSFLGAGKIEEGYACYLTVNFRKDLASFFPRNFLASPPEDKNTELLILSVYGPGDEIRFASIYKDIKQDYPNIKISCEERLFSLLSRSFKDIEIISVRRTRNISPVNGYVYEDYNDLPTSTFCSVMDNQLHEHIINSNTLCVTDFISKYRTSRNQFPGEPIFLADIDKAHEINKKLPKNEMLIGINWRSSLSGFTRNVHYLEVEQLAPIFELEGITFVNLQYDDCIEELNWVDKNFPNKMINLTEIDQYNDFESVAALMTNLDLVIAPCTSVAELSGALGVDTLLLSNSAEIKWRSAPDTKQDIWFSSIEHVEANIPGDKLSLVDNLKSKLIEIRDSKTNKVSKIA